VNIDPTFHVPSGFPTPVYDPVAKGMTQDGYLLGKKLFFDPLLSQDGTISCASCHQPENAFSDRGQIFSTGVNGLQGSRNSPPIFNLAWQPYFMWDGGVNHIEVMPIAPITHPAEMNESLNNILFKLQNNAEYSSLFYNVYGTYSINSAMLLKSLAWYMTSIVSYQSKYDRVIGGEDHFTLQEQEGYNIFMSKCSSCHTPPLFTDYTFRNNGILGTTGDSGRFRITLQFEDMHTYKVPSLRNIEVTEPYMHDGQLATLEEVIDHYNDGILYNPNLDTILIDDNFIELNNSEKQNLIKFLKTLTDSTFLYNQEYLN